MDLARRSQPIYHTTYTWGHWRCRSHINIHHIRVHVHVDVHGNLGMIHMVRWQAVAVMLKVPGWVMSVEEPLWRHEVIAVHGLLVVGMG